MMKGKFNYCKEWGTRNGEEGTGKKERGRRNGEQGNEKNPV
jgi:hypothetical protein